jgi:hypothetical protein
VAYCIGPEMTSALDICTAPALTADELPFILKMLHITSRTIGVKTPAGCIWRGTVTGKRDFRSNTGINTCSTATGKCTQLHFMRIWIKKKGAAIRIWSTSTAALLQQRSGYAIYLLHRAFPTLSTALEGFTYSEAIPQPLDLKLHGQWFIRNKRYRR